MSSGLGAPSLPKIWQQGAVADLIAMASRAATIIVATTSPLLNLQTHGPRLHETLTV